MNKNDDTRYLNNDEQTAIISDNQYLDNAPTADATPSETAPASKKKTDMKGVTQKAAFTAGGFVVGAAAGAAVSAAASSNNESTSDSKLAQAATPDDENTPEQAATDAHVDDPSTPPASDENISNANHSDNTNNGEAWPEPAPKTDATAEQPTTVQPTPAGDEQQATLIGENPIGDSRIDAPATQNTGEAWPDHAPAQDAWPEDGTNTEAWPEDGSATTVNPEHDAAATDINNIHAAEEAATIVQPQVEINSIGSTMNADGSVMNHADVTINDIHATFVDVDGDGTVDIALVDTDGDGLVNADSPIDVSDTGLTMDDIASQMDVPESNYDEGVCLDDGLCGDDMMVTDI